MAEHITGGLARVFAGARKIALAKARWRRRHATDTQTETRLRLADEDCASLAAEFQTHADAVRSQLVEYAELLAGENPELQVLLEQIAREQPWPST